jgi:hypothetical protein
MENRPKKPLDEVREVIRRKHYSRRTERTYVSWIRRFILCHEKRHPRDMGKKEIETFLPAAFFNLTGGDKPLHATLLSRSSPVGETAPPE